MQVQVGDRVRIDYVRPKRFSILAFLGEEKARARLLRGMTGTVYYIKGKQAWVQTDQVMPFGRGNIRVVHMKHLRKEVTT